MKAIFVEQQQVSVKTDDGEWVGTIIRELHEDEFEGAGMRAWEVRLADGVVIHAFENELQGA